MTSDKHPSRKQNARVGVLDRPVRPGDICPVCSAETVVDSVETCSHGGPVHIDICRTCQAVWERETRADPAVEPCSNCAFLPGSPEFKSGEIIGIVDKTIDGPGIFYCHRRVPFEVKTGKRFLHQMDGERSRCTNARVCAGWIRAKLADKHGRPIRFEVRP